MVKPTLVFGRVGREQLPSDLKRQFNVLTLPLSAEAVRGSYTTDARWFRNLIRSRWNNRVFDLLNIICVVRAADRYFVSKGLFRWSREVPIAVGVTDPAHWRKLRTPLAQAVKALSGDSLLLFPVPLRKVPELSMPELGVPLAMLGKRTPDSVCLYSGGADSLAGAAHLLHRRRRPVLISHSVGSVSGLQKRLFAALSERFPVLQPEWLVQIRAYPNAIDISGSSALHWQYRDQLQRLRSIFFFSIAAIMAQAIDVDEIFMCENGLIGAAIIFSPYYDNPYTTRPAEPHYLRAMEQFLQLALELPGLHIRNPFQYMTKGEVLHEAVTLGLEDSLYQSVSCWRSGNRTTKNCGRCVPCLFRQLAFDEAGLRTPSKYSYPFAIPRIAWRRWRSPELERLVDMRYYCERVLKGGLRALMAEELAVIDAVDVTGGPARQLWNEDGFERREREAPFKVGKTILRFARATLARLP